MSKKPKKNTKISTKFDQKAKAKFRSGPDWRQFRIDRLAERDGICDCCKRKFTNSSKFHVHHRDLRAEHYTDISNHDNFSVLCSPCHTMVHSLHTLVISKKNPTSNQAIIDLQKPYFI